LKTSNDEKKAVLLDSLRQVRGEILAAARQFHPGEETVAFVGFWSLLDLLAHLAGRDVTNRKSAQEMLAGTLPSFYNYQSKDWADYNAMLVSQYWVDSLTEMLAAVARTHQELMEYLASLNARDLFSDHGVRRGNYRVIINSLLEAERKDEIQHLRQMVEFLDELRT
jgi:hypothetical protein